MAGPGCPPACDLYNKGDGFALPTGTGKNGVMLLGEALGTAEAKQGRPFVGPAGIMLGVLLHRLGLDRDDFLVANVVNCRPPRDWLEGAPWQEDAIEHCRPYFEQTLADNPQIKVIVPMGNVALYYLLGQKGIANFHGTVHRHHRLNKWIVPTFHPAHLMRGNFEMIQVGRFDIEKACEVREWDGHEKLFDSEPTDYILQPSATVAQEYLRDYLQALANDPTTTLASDIETPRQPADEDATEDKVDELPMKIERISFSYRAGHAITMPWEGQYVDVARKMLAAAGSLVFWNGDRFDIPRLEAENAACNNTVDAQEGWHFLYPDLPKKLGFVSPFFTKIKPWKHLKGVEEPFYSCVDSDSLLQIWQAIQVKIKAAGRWDTFQKDIVEINHRTRQMSANGIAIDNKDRLTQIEIIEGRQAIIVSEVQDLVPNTLKNIHPKRGYKNTPADVTGMRQVKIEDVVLEEGKQLVKEFTRWAKIVDFNLNSHQQLLKYIEFKHGQSAVPKHKRTGTPSAEGDQIERLAKKTSDPVLIMAVESKKLQSKVGHLTGWKPQSDGLIHTTFTNNPATFRFSAKRPNVHNLPGRTEEYQRIRQMVIPGAGYKWLVSRDYNGAEPIQVGHYAGDSDYIRLAERGIHAYLGLYFLGEQPDIPTSDSQLDELIREAKIRTKAKRVPGGYTSTYAAAKRTVNGLNNGMTAHLMQVNYPEVFPARKDALRAARMYFDLFPKIKKWQDNLVDRAHREAHLVNDFGYVRWFWYVKKPIKRGGKWVWVRAEDAKKVLANQQQSSAAIIMRRAMSSNDAKYLLDQGQLFLTVHDELIARAKDDQDAAAVSIYLRQAMEFPVVEQGGKIFKTSVKQGVNWGEMA